MKTDVVGTHLNHLSKLILMSTHNTFYVEKRNIFILTLAFYEKNSADDKMIFFSHFLLFFFARK